MKKRLLPGLLPIICLICLGIFYSVIHEIYDSNQSKQALVSLLKPSNWLLAEPAISTSYTLEKETLNNESLDQAIGYLLKLGYLPESVVNTDIQYWKVTSDSTANLVYQNDTFHIVSTQYTLKTPFGITLIR